MIDLEKHAEAILATALRNGGQLAEIFLEETVRTSIILENNKVERVVTGTDVGAGIRHLSGDQTLYGHTNELTEPSLIALAAEIAGGARGDAPACNFAFAPERLGAVPKVPPSDVPSSRKLELIRNANAAVRRDLAIEHPYNETLPGLEDLDWATRMMNAGYKIHYAPEAEIIHVHNETPRAVFNRYKREAIAFKHIYIHERFGFLDFVRLSARNIVRDMQNAAHDGELLPSFGSIIWFRLCQFWGTYQGYRYSGPLTWQLRQRFYYPNGIQQGNQPIERPVKPIDYHAIQ